MLLIRTSICASLLFACRVPATEASSDAATTPVSADATSPIAADPTRPLALPLEVWASVPDGGFALGADAGALPVGAAFEIRVAARIRDLRVRLVDGSGRALDADDHLEVGRSTRYRLHPTGPLLPGTGYSLDIGPHAATAVLTDGAGRSYADARIAFRTEGDPPRPAPKSPKRPRR